MFSGRKAWSCTVLRFQSVVLAAVLSACDVEANVGYWLAPPHAAAAGSEASMGDALGTPDAGHMREPEGVPTGTIAPDAGVMVPGSVSGDPQMNGADAGVGQQLDACRLARSLTAPLDVTVVDANAVTYNFANGASFPAGRYQIAYVDGCRRYDNTEAWTLHASVLASGLSPQGRGGCYLVMSNDQALDLAPGTAGVVVGEGPDPLGAFATYDECVAANRKLAPFEHQFTGGTIGVMNAGDSSPDKTPGEAVGGRSPTYRLTRLDDCP